MKFKYYFKRIVNNKIKLAVILLIFILPIIDVCLILLDINNGGSAIQPNLASFLTGSIFNVTQTILLWYLPLYFLIVVADDCIEDFKIGYKNVLVTKWGKKGYFFTNIVKGFLFGILLLFISLAFNLIITQIAFSGGSYSLYDSLDIQKTEALKVAFDNPLLTNCIYIIFSSFIAGVVTMGAVAISIALRNRFLVYPIVFLMWYIPSLLPGNQITRAMQPFTENLLIDALPTILLVIFINIIAVVFAYIKEVKYEKI